MKKCKFEYFGSYNFHRPLTENVFNIPKKFYYQERDWTCSIAMLRTITSSIKDIGLEDEIIKKYNFIPSPYYSEQLKEKGVLDNKDITVLYGCDNKNCDISDIIHLLKEGYFVGLETMINYDHWVVLLGYSKLGDYDEDVMLYFCPYFYEVRTIHFSEFIEMWRSGNYENNKIVNDFIAVK